MVKMNFILKSGKQTLRLANYDLQNQVISL